MSTQRARLTRLLGGDSVYGPWWTRLLERTPWWQRIYGDGWDQGIDDAVRYVERLLTQHAGPTVPRAGLEQLAADLRRELENA
ncbi:hypothetical protein [Kribbella sp. NPDC051620]|uniref:hypothetical protein n=1 Tax=Kribbella sp. NPDC051620 TaxID=3364120 RepID=UPI0037AFE860